MAARVAGCDHFSALDGHRPSALIPAASSPGLRCPVAGMLQQAKLAEAAAQWRTPMLPQHTERACHHFHDVFARVHCKESESLLALLHNAAPNASYGAQLLAALRQPGVWARGRHRMGTAGGGQLLATGKVVSTASASLALSLLGRHCCNLPPPAHVLPCLATPHPSTCRIRGGVCPGFLLAAAAGAARAAEEQHARCRPGREGPAGRLPHHLRRALRLSSPLAEAFRAGEGLSLFHVNEQVGRLGWAAGPACYATGPRLPSGLQARAACYVACNCLSGAPQPCSLATHCLSCSFSVPGKPTAAATRNAADNGAAARDCPPAVHQRQGGQRHR